MTYFYCPHGSTTCNATTLRLRDHIRPGSDEADYVTVFRHFTCGELQCLGLSAEGVFPFRYYRDQKKCEEHGEARSYKAIEALRLPEIHQMLARFMHEKPIQPFLAQTQKMLAATAENIIRQRRPPLKLLSRGYRDCAKFFGDPRINEKELRECLEHADCWLQVALVEARVTEIQLTTDGKTKISILPEWAFDEYGDMEEGPSCYDITRLGSKWPATVDWNELWNVSGMFPPFPFSRETVQFGVERQEMEGLISQWIKDSRNNVRIVNDTSGLEPFGLLKRHRLSSMSASKCSTYGAFMLPATSDIPHTDKSNHTKRKVQQERPI
jgi:hypothetical protein